MTAIITDSTCDLSKEQREQLGVKSAPLLVNFADASYRDNVDLTLDEFYRKLRTCERLPTTSQVNPVDFEAIFRPLTEQGDDIVGIFISSGLSGTYQSSLVAKEAIGSDRIHLIDSFSATVGMGALVKTACDLRDQGVPAAEIAAHLGELVPRLRVLIIVDTLKYLHMGGRLSATSAVLGNMLGITPIISIINGKVEAIGKVRGKKQSYEFVLSRILQDPPDERYPMVIGHADAAEKLVSFREHLEGHLDLSDALVSNIGCVIGTHIGPGSVGIAYIAK